METNALLSVSPEVIGERLARARRIRGLTQEQAAEALEVTQAMIAEVEKGDRHPRARELYALSRLYERPIGSLVRPIRDDANSDLMAQCLAAYAKDSMTTERERNTQHCEDFSYWYAELEEMVGSTPVEEPHATMYDRFEVLAARAFAEALISEGQLARILETDRISALQFGKERLRDQ